MKYLRIVFIILLTEVLPMSAQTYYYKYLYTIKKSSGMKINENCLGMYLTFTNGKKTVYESKKDGTAKDEMPSVLIGNKNGMLIYKEKVLPAGPFPKPDWRPSWHSYTFSEDYSRMNYHTTLTESLKDNVRVYERGSEPEMQGAPEMLY